jgi:hypothetical protein
MPRYDRLRGPAVVNIHGGAGLCDRWWSARMSKMTTHWRSTALAYVGPRFERVGRRRTPWALRAVRPRDRCEACLARPWSCISIALGVRRCFKCYLEARAART